MYDAHTGGRIRARGDATFMIGSVTKLTLYAEPLEPRLTKTMAEKRDAFKGAPLQPPPV